MKATEAKLLEFLKKSPQFIIPIYQRIYSWTERECRQLWDDIIRTGKNEAISAHFMGSIVYIEKGLYHVSNQSPLLVIDGQQRLTTIALILEALSRNLKNTEPVEGFSPKKLRHYYLLNPLEEGEKGYKLLLTQTDKDSLLALMQQVDLPSDHSIRIKENFEFFEDQIQKMGDDLSALCNGLAKLMVVDISLSRDQDNPQLIFESMNSTGRELSQADLIRNFILMGLEPDQQTRLYEHHWRPMEVAFGQEAYDKHFDAFMRHYLTIKTGDIPNVRKVYEAFKEHARTPNNAQAGVNALVADIHMYAKYYCAMALGQEEDKQLKLAFQDLRDLKVDVSYPLLLALYHDYRTAILGKDDFEHILRLIESYVFRRAICNIPTNSLNKTFATFSKSLNKEKYLESVMAHLIMLPSYRRFPRDEEFKREVQTRDIYNLRTRSYFLRRLENFGRKERVIVDEYTIEHIMPQNENLPSAWQTALGADWQSVQENWLHTLGNLTLTGYNSEYSDHPFAEKRDKEGGFKHSPLKLNQGLGELEHWNEDTIKVRALRLAQEATHVWDSPNLPEAILATYKTKEKASATYTIDDHDYLAERAAMRPLFEALRKEILALNPAVTEEFLKFYVAYKAETNFVDVVPQASRLRLSLNMAFHEVFDPKGICKDTTNLGRRGNGDVEVPLSTTDGLPYVMGLIRKALEKQMGNGG
jgi:uncharacterized protein with ParB-like and HNH nuclease domain/predicted transport protein